MIEAFRFGHDPPEWFKFSVGLDSSMAATHGGRAVTVEGDGSSVIIHTLEGDHRAYTGDWIIKGVMGELYPRRHDIFLMTYEKVE